MALPSTRLPGCYANALHRALGLYQFQETRIKLYENYREMDSDPMIAAVLDAFADDAGQFDPEHGRIVWVEAQNQEIQAILTQTLERLRIDELAFPIMRSLARDGDVFEHVALGRGQGVLALRPYEPWTVSRLEDDIGRLIGFAPANESGEPTDVKGSAVAPHKVLHFRLQGRDRTDDYGASSSFLWGSRITWRELQLMEDQIVMQRLLRRPDRLLILMDAAGMSHDDAWLTVKRWERRFHREWYLNPASSEFRSQGLPLDGAKDMILPRGPNNSTSIENFPATNTNDLLRDLDFILARLAAGIGFPLGFVGRGSERGDYQSGQSLSRQSQPFAKRATRLQRAFLHEIARMLKIDLAYRGLDPFHGGNQFILRMASVAPIVEIERAEVIQLRMDRLDRALQLGQNYGLDMGVWTPYVLEKYGGFPKDLVAQVYKAAAGGAKGGSEEMGGGSPWESEDDKRRRAEALNELTKMLRCELPNNVGVPSHNIEIARDSEVYRPRQLNEAHTDLVTCDLSVSNTVTKRARGGKTVLRERKRRMETRVDVLTAVCGLPPEGNNGSRWKKWK